MPGLSVQRAVTAAGWHLRIGGGRNVVSYQVMRKGERGGSLSSGTAAGAFFLTRCRKPMTGWLEHSEPAMRKDQESSA